MSAIRVIGNKKFPVYRMRNYLGEDYISVANVTPEQLASLGAPDQVNTYVNSQGKLYRYLNGTWIDFYPFNNGTPGRDGASAYQLAVSRGYTGSLDEWLASLQGAPGNDGKTGADGKAGPPNTLSIGTVQTLASGVNATAAINGTAPNQTLDLGLPRGPAGKDGPPVSLSIGGIATLPAGQSATVAIKGTPPSQVLEFGIPAGAKGDPGPTPTIRIGTVSTVAAGGSATASISGSGLTYTLDLGIPAGQKGDDGSMYGLTIGTITTLPAGSSAVATITDNKLSLGIPAGTPGPSSSIAMGTVTTLTSGSSATASIANGTLNLGIPGSKRIETYVGTTDANGLFTVSYTTPYSGLPTVVPEPPSAANQQWIKVSSNLAGFSYRLVQRSSASVLGIDLLVSATTVVSGAPVRAVVVAP
jgi:hypothetical protein